MMRHVTIMLKLVADGVIVKPRAPSIPEMQDRPRAGDVTGDNTILVDKMTQLRQEKWRQYMAAAEHNPEKYSKVVSIPAQDQGLVGKKIEVWMQMEEEVHVEGPDGEAYTVNKYLHCFEGTIVEVHEQSAACKSRTVSKVRSKWAIVKVEWDVEFLHWRKFGYQALNPDLYAREESAGGWNILSEEYTLACKVAEAQYAELAATFKNKSIPDSEYFQDQVVNGRSGFGSGSESESEDGS